MNWLFGEDASVLTYMSRSVKDRFEMGSISYAQVLRSRFVLPARRRR